MREGPSVRVSYAIAIGAVAAAIVLRALLTPLIGSQLPLATLYGAVAIAVWFGGAGPALLAAALGYLAAELLFVEPGSPITATLDARVAVLGVYLFSCLIIVGLGSQMRAARSRFEAAARESQARQATLEREMAEREATESMLRAKEAELALITQRTPLQLSRCSKDLRYVFVNRAYASFVGRAPESIIGRPIVEILGERALAAIRPHIERVLRGEVVEYETEIPYPHPGPRFMHVVYSPDRDEAGQVIGWIASIIDVSERHRNEEALRRSEERLATELAAMTRMQRVSTRLVQAGDFPQLLGEILDASIEITRADMGNIQLLEGSVLKIFSQRGFDTPFLDFFSGVEAGDATGCGTAMLSQERVIVEDVASSEVFAGTPAREVVLAAGVRAVQSTPLVSRSGTLFGMLSTHYRARYRPSEHELRILDVLGRQASDLIERTRNETALREADRQKDDFLAVLAHELRNPLAPIRTAVQLLRLEKEPSTEALAANDIIDRQTRQLARLIDDLMDISRITRNRLELRKEAVELARIVEDAVETSRPLIDERGHRLGIDLPSQPVVLDGDATRLAQVFSNLLNNAARYSEPGARIQLAAERGGDQVSISIRDSGMGITSAQLPRIFEGAVPSESAPDGLGIGLMLVRRLVEMHGGSVAARSDGPGKGSEFVVRLPIASAQTTNEPQLQPGASLAPAPARRRILIADDNRDAATSLARMLERLGYETQSAHDGENAFALAASFRPDVALLDLGMPKANGLDVARQIRLQPWGRRTVLVAITGWGQAEDKQRTGAAGFDHHLVKPVSPHDLATLLASVGLSSRSEADPATRGASL